MAIDVETLKTEIEEYLKQSNLAVFQGITGPHDVSTFWNTEREPDFRKFLGIAEKAGAKLIVFDFDQFTQNEIDDGFENLEGCGFGREERRQYETRMRELQKYEGFTSHVELSFHLDGRVYSYRVQADWYREWQDLVEDLDIMSDVEDGDENDPLPGYFSTN
jgi:hypothetical protein